MPSYEAIYVIPPMCEGLNLRSSLMDFQVMGLIWKLITWSLVVQEFVKLSRSVTEKSDQQGSLPDQFLFTTAKSSYNKIGVDASSLSTQFSVTVRLSFTKCRQIQD